MEKEQKQEFDTKELNEYMTKMVDTPLRKYLKKAKANGWTLDMFSLAAEYKVTYSEVRLAVEEIYNNS